MKGHRMLTSTPLARRFWTGLNDDHLASIGFANFAWNVLERKFASLVWVAADWSQEIGELVTADLGNVSMATLFINIIKQSVTDDDRILCQATRTVAVLDGIRSDRNNLIHSFFHRDPTKTIGKYIKVSAKSRSGGTEIKTIAMSKTDIDQLCADISTCFDSVDDLVHKLHFRRKFLAGERGALAQNYDDAVHGWRAPSFDTSLLREYLKRRSQRLNPPPNRPPPLSSPP
jgi:hypothetical protein